MEQSRVVGGEILIKAVERGYDAVVRLDTFDKERHGIGEGDLLRARGRLVVLLPQREQQCLDALALLHVKHLVRRIKRVEADGTFVRIGKIHPVLALRLVAYHLAQPLIAVSRVHQDDMGILFPVLPQEVVGEKRLSRARWSQDKLVAVGDDTFLHRQVGNIQMNRLATAVCHLDTKWRERILVVGLLVEEADRLFDECVERFFGGEVGFIARDACPEERRHVHSVVPWLALHQGELAAYVIADASEFLAVLAPCQHVAVAADGGKSEAVRLVQILVYPLLVDLVASAVARERVHVPCVLLEALQVLRTVVNEHILVVYVAARQQQSYGSGKRKAAVAAVGGKTLVTHIRSHLSRQVVRVGEGMQAESLVTDTHPVGSQVDVFQYRRVGEGK